MVWETALDAAHSEAGHFLGDRPGLLPEVIYELESQFINLQESHICLPNRSMAAICLRRSLPAGNSMWRPAMAWKLTGEAQGGERGAYSLENLRFPQPSSS